MHFIFWISSVSFLSEDIHKHEIGSINRINNIPQEKEYRTIDRYAPNTCPPLIRFVERRKPIRVKKYGGEQTTTCTLVTFSLHGKRNWTLMQSYCL